MTPRHILSTLLLLTSACFSFAGEIKHIFVATDESGGQLIYVDESNPHNDWTVKLNGNRDLQVLDTGRILVSVRDGYKEFDLKTGKLLKEVKTGKGIQSAVRLDNGHTLLAGSRGIIELDKDDNKVAEHTYVLGGFFRLLRVSRDGNYLYTSSATTIREAKPNGATVREMDLTTLTPESRKPYFIEELPDGRFLIATGYGATVLLVDKDWKLLKTFGGKGKIDGIDTYFFADAQMLKNGHIVVAHWSGHARKDSEKAPQAIEFDEEGKVVWTWHDPDRAGTLHGIQIIE